MALVSAVAELPALVRQRPRRARFTLPSREEKTPAADRASPEKAAPDQPAENDDVELVVRFQAGDESAFRTLVERYQERAFWISRGMVGNDEDARDVTQEAFVRVFRSIGKFDTRLRFYTWFYQIVVNLSIDHLRRAKHRRRASLDEMGDAAENVTAARIALDGDAGVRALEQEETRMRVERVLAELPPKYRAVIVLRDLQGHGGKDVAAVEGATHATVRWRLHRARKMFRDAWERLYGRHGASEDATGGGGE
jgi:RNA polymerase sigma-70 factor (ECF subfamily)